MLIRSEVFLFSETLRYVPTYKNAIFGTTSLLAPVSSWHNGFIKRTLFEFRKDSTFHGSIYLVVMERSVKIRSSVGSVFNFFYRSGSGRFQVLKPRFRSRSRFSRSQNVAKKMAKSGDKKVTGSSKIFGEGRFFRKIAFYCIFM